MLSLKQAVKWIFTLAIGVVASLFGIYFVWLPSKLGSDLPLVIYPTYIVSLASFGLVYFWYKSMNEGEVSRVILSSFFYMFFSIFGVLMSVQSSTHTSDVFSIYNGVLIGSVAVTIAYLVILVDIDKVVISRREDYKILK